jgi:hypothetical protein
MRTLLVMTVMVMLGSVAHADMVDVRDPPIVEACPHAATWPLMLACISKHGFAATVVGTLDDANLVALATNDKAAAFQGFALYVHAGAVWRIGGLTQNGGNLADYDVMRFEHVHDIGRKRGYRLDLAFSQPTSATLDNLTSVSMFSRQLIGVFCSGTSYGCIEIVEKCEQIVHGQTISAFDGAITVRDNQLSLIGAGTTPACSANGDYSF